MRTALKVALPVIFWSWIATMYPLFVLGLAVLAVTGLVFENS
jgi:predicted RND superfamily exporter protein